MVREILIVADNEKNIDALEKGIDGEDYLIKTIINFDVNLNQYLKDNPLDVIVIDVEVPLSIYLDKIREVYENTPMPIVMFTQMKDQTVTIENVIEAGVHAFIVNNVEPNRIVTIIDTAVARFKQYQSISEKLKKTEATLEERKILDRAKGILMENRNLNEQESYALLRKMAMDQNKKIAEVATNVIEMFNYMK